MKPTTVQLSLVNQTICFDETITFLVSDSATSYYSWDFDESSIEEVLNDNTGELTLKFTTAGTYVITVVEFNEILCAGDTLTFNVIVEEEVNADFTFMIDALNAVNFTNESTGATSYEWDFGDGGASDEFSPMHIYLENGVYEVMLIISSDLGCSDTLITSVTIEGLGQNEIITNASIVYPNPFVDELSIKSIGSSSYVSIMNLHGELIYENQFSGLVEISTAYWPSGIYLLQLIQEDGAIANQKFIKL
jgi:PKD repeat protein